MKYTLKIKEHVYFEFNKKRRGKKPKLTSLQGFRISAAKKLSSYESKRRKMTCDIHLGEEKQVGFTHQSAPTAIYHSHRGEEERGRERRGGIVVLGTMTNSNNYSLEVSDRAEIDVEGWK